MPKYIVLKDHLSPEEIKAAWRSCTHPVEKAHWFLLWRYATAGPGTSLPTIARQCGLEQSWARRLVYRYNALGVEGLKDRRQDNGSQPYLDTKGLERLRAALNQPPEDGGLWSGPKVAQWISKVVGQQVRNATGWHYLKRLKWSWKVPRPRHAAAATPQEAAAYKKTRRGHGKSGSNPSRQKGRVVGRG